jgi:integrase
LKEVLRLFGKGEAGQRRVTLQEYAAGFFRWGESPWIARQHSKGRPFSKTVARERQSHLDNHVLPHFGRKTLADLNRVEIENWLLSLPLSAQTKNHILYSFRIVLRSAKAERLIADNPLADSEPFGRDARKRDVFTMAELVALFPGDREKFFALWGEQKYATMMLVLATSGIRSGEARALAWRHVLSGALLIEQAVKADGSIGPTKGREQRVVLLPRRTCEALEDWQQMTPWPQPANFIFYGPNGDHALNKRTVLDVFRRGLQKAEINVGERNLVPHSFRHLANSMMRRALPEEVLRSMLGHKSEPMSQRYDHLDTQLRLKQLESSRKLVEGVWKAMDKAEKAP